MRAVCCGYGYTFGYTRIVRKAVKKLARNHHFLSQGYLAGFTDDGTREGQLFVWDIVSRRSPFQTKSRNVAAERDFNRIEVDGYDPDIMERQLGEFEGEAISVIRGIQASGELPPDEEFSYVINLMALLVVHNPRSRRAMNSARRQTVRVIGDLLTSDRRLFEYHIAKAKGDGFVRQDAEVSFEAIRKFIEDDQYSVTISTSESVFLELRGFEKALESVGSRYWSLVTAAADAPDFVTCDHPVTAVFKDPMRRGPIGYGLPHTEVSFPLNTRQALLGVFEGPLSTRIEVRHRHVAEINRRTIHHAYRQVYSKTRSVAGWASLEEGQG